MKTRQFITTSLLFILILALSVSCHKKEKVEPELVPITTTGANTMGFYVDGVLINIEGIVKGFINPHGVTGGIFENEVINIFGFRQDPKLSLNIYFPKDSLTTINEIYIDESIFNYEQIRFIDNSPLGGRLFTCDSLHQGMVKILRLDNGIISGTFEFEAINDETGKVIHVTDGRFDFKWK